MPILSVVFFLFLLPLSPSSYSFITFKSCHHLDRKHSVFGKLVGGMDVLTKLERVRTEKDRPLVSLILIYISLEILSLYIVLITNDQLKVLTLCFYRMN